MMSMYTAVSEVVSPVYLVGGSVRDSIMGRECDDYDFATSLNPDDIEAAVHAAGKHAYTVGKRFGTIGFKVNGRKVEVTTFRQERYEKSSRKPTVEFVGDITSDLSRRDFTINALAFRSHIIDPFNGRDDIENGVIRAVGNARSRFKDDPLRMLRAARFAAQFGFTVAPETIDAGRRLCHRILMVSRERWVMELDKLLLSDKPSVGLRVLAEMDVLRYVLPHINLQVGYDQNSCYHSLELWEHTLAVVDGVPADIELRWAALLHDIGKPYVRQEKVGRSIYVKHDLLGAELVAQVASYLKWPNARSENVYALVRDHLLGNSPLKAADDAGKRHSGEVL